MAKSDLGKAPDHGDADAAGESMQHLAVDHASLSRRTTCGDNMPRSASDTRSLTPTSNADSHGSEAESQHSIQPENRQSAGHIETTLAHRTALKRLNGVKSNKPVASGTGSSAVPQPVLVKTYSRSDQARTAEMGRPRKPNVETSELPPLESFSFQDILKEIDPEIKASVDAIAEIYGRSKLSLADEYGSHRPPMGGLELLDHADALEAIQRSRLEPVNEGTQDHSRRQSLALVGTSTQAKSGLSSSAVAATSIATSVSQNRRQSASVPVGSRADTPVAILPYILSWLRNSHGRSECPAGQIPADPRAVESLQRILGDS